MTLGPVDFCCYDGVISGLGRERPCSDQSEGCSDQEGAQVNHAEDGLLSP